MWDRKVTQKCQFLSLFIQVYQKVTCWDKWIVFNRIGANSFNLCFMSFAKKAEEFYCEAIGFDGHQIRLGIANV